MADKTKIDERREREAYDKAHPWHPMVEAVTNSGIVCELQRRDLTVLAGQFFLGEDDAWYRLDPPSREYSGLMNWRPADPLTKLTPGKRGEIIVEANKTTDWRW